MRILLALVALLVFTSPVDAVEEPERWNILWLSCEDLSPRLGCYGDETVPTPHIDRLACEGVRYTHAFTATGVCAPCRHTIITGLYPMQSGAQYMRTGQRTSAIDQIADPVLRERAKARPLYEATPPAGVRCFPELLRAAGYYCTNNSKQDYQFKAPATVWDDSSRKAHYENRAEGQPFFAVFNHTVTHESGVHGQKPRSPSVVDPADVSVPSFLPDTPVVRSDIARHYDNIARLDRWVGKKLDELEAAGLAESTIVFFFSDHGDGLPRHKRWVYDSGTHVPLLVRIPGWKADAVDPRLMSFVDLAPTVLSLAGIDAPDYMEGRLFTGPDAVEPPDYVYMHRDRMDDVAHETIRSVRDPRFRYVRNYRPQQPYLLPIAYRDRAATMGEIYRLKEAGELTPAQWQWSVRAKPLEELYDTQADPDEVVNLASDPRHAAKLAELRAALEEWTTRIDDPLAMPEIDVLRTRIWPPEGEQPVTGKVTVERVRSAGDVSRIILRCETEDASLGYRFRKTEPWNVYAGPFETIETDTLHVVAHRIGWKPMRSQFDL